MNDEIKELRLAALMQIVEDVIAGDTTAIAELLEHVPEAALRNYIPEGLE
jgi:hypothetical protein